MNQVWVGRRCISLSTPSEDYKSLAIKTALSSFLVNSNFTLLRSWHLNQIRTMTVVPGYLNALVFRKTLIRPWQTGRLM